MQRDIYRGDITDEQRQLNYARYRLNCVRENLKDVTDPIRRSALEDSEKAIQAEIVRLTLLQ